MRTVNQSNKSTTRRIARRSLITAALLVVAWAGPACTTEGDVATIQGTVTDEVVFITGHLTGGSPAARVTLTPQEICTTAINYAGVAGDDPDTGFYSDASDDLGTGSVGRFDEQLCDSIVDIGGRIALCTPPSIECPGVSPGAYAG